MAYYSEHAQQLKRDLAAEVPTDELRTLHAKRPLLHALIAFLNVAALVAVSEGPRPVAAAALTERAAPLAATA